MTNLSVAVDTATNSRRARLLAVVGAIFALTAATAPASADTLVYVKSGTIYVSQPDGSQARPITTGANGWAWPSETDSGIVAVAGGLPRTDGTFNPSGSDEIYEFDQQGKQVAGPVASDGTYSTVGDPEYATHFRVAPDNSNVAWTVTAPNAYSNPITSWRNPNGSGSFSYAEDCCGPLSYSNPEWWGSGRLLITHDGATIGSQPNFTFYNLATGSNTGWSGDQAIGSSGASQVTVSRNGLLYAIETDDGYDHNGTIQNVSITLETGNTPPNSFGSTTSITAGCKITLPASAFATNHGASEISMSFSSDGKTLAWGQDDGVYEANVSAPSNCGNVAGSVHRVVAGGQMPFLGAAALSPANPAPKPGPTPPGPTPPAPCCGPNPGLTGPPSTAISGFHLNRHSHSAAVRFRGSGGTGSLSFRCKLDGGRWMRCRSPQRYRHLRKGRHTFQVVAIDHRGTVDRTPAKRRFSV